MESRGSRCRSNDKRKLSGTEANVRQQGSWISIAIISRQCSCVIDSQRVGTASSCFHSRCHVYSAVTDNLSTDQTIQKQVYKLSRPTVLTSTTKENDHHDRNNNNNDNNNNTNNNNNKK